MLVDLEVGDEHNFMEGLSDKAKFEIEVCECFITNGTYKGEGVNYLCGIKRVLARNVNTTELNKLANELFPDMNRRIAEARTSLR